MHEPIEAIWVRGLARDIGNVEQDLGGDTQNAADTQGLRGRKSVEPVPRFKGVVPCALQVVDGLGGAGEDDLCADEEGWVGMRVYGAGGSGVEDVGVARPADGGVVEMQHPVVHEEHAGCQCAVVVSPVAELGCQCFQCLRGVVQLCSVVEISVLGNKIAEIRGRQAEEGVSRAETDLGHLHERSVGIGLYGNRHARTDSIDVEISKDALHVFTRPRAVWCMLHQAWKTGFL